MTRWSRAPVPHVPLMRAADPPASRSRRGNQMKSGSYRQRVLTLAAVATALALSACGALDRDAVQNEISTAASTAAEGMLVAREAKGGRTTKSFVVIRTAELHGAAQKSEQKLTEPTENGLAKSAEQGSKLAAQVRAALGALHGHPNDRRLAASTENRLHRLADELDRVERRL